MRFLYTIIIYIIFSLIPVPAKSQVPNSQIDTIVKLHNFYRNVVGVPDIAWSQDLAQKAQQWADQIAKYPLITHNDLGFTQNIFYTYDTTRLYEAVNFWAKEQIFYHGQTLNDTNIYLFRHYTAIIWHDTKYIGCGLARLKSGIYVMVCFYSPSGNILGEKPVK